MFKNWLPLFVLILVFSCQNDSADDYNLIDFLPSETSIYFEGDNLESIQTQVQNSDFISKIADYSSNSDILPFLKTLNNFHSTEKAILGFSKDSLNGMVFNLMVKTDSIVFRKDSISDIKIETLKSKNETLTKYSLGESVIYSKHINGIEFYSNNEKTARGFGVKRSKPEANRFQKLKTGQNTLIFKSTPEKQIPIKIFLNDSLNSLEVADRVSLEFIENETEIYANGVADDFKSNNTFIEFFKGTVPQQNRFSEFVPEDIDYALSITFDDKEKFAQNISSVKSVDSLQITWPFNNTIEIAQFRRDSETAIILQTLDPATSLSNLEDKSLTETYRDIDLYATNEESNPFSTFDLLFPNSDFEYFFNIDDIFIFSGDLSILKNIIGAIQSENTLSQSESFLGIMQNMSDEASAFVYFNGKGLNDLINLNIGEEKNLSFEKVEKSAIQIIRDSDFAHVNAVLRKSGKTSNIKAINEQLQSTLDSEILSGPFFLENQLSRNMDFYVQDVNNYLYVFDNSGQQLFKKLLDGPLLGKIEQLDSFKNGRQQLAFATSNTLYMLSREGKDVSNFPIKFKDKVTQPLSLFDYDNNHRYRLLVTQGKDLLMLDKDGKRVNGFKFEPSDNFITSQPKHIRIGRKDFIVYAQEDGIRMLSRTGKDRLKVASKFNFSDNEIYELQDKFSFTDVSGNLVQIDQNGGISKEKMNIAENHKFVSTSRTPVVLADNILKIRSNSVELPFGNYSDPRIFYINDKIYVSVTDLQTNKVFVYDSQGQEISGFPVYGSSAVDIGKIDKDNNLELIVRSGNNGIIIYQFN